MKKEYSLTIFLGVSYLLTIAQPTLNGNDHVVPEQKFLGVLDGNVPGSFTQGSSGVNQTWDFSTWQGSDYIIDMLTYSSSSNFAAANRRQIASTTRTSYFLSTSQQYAAVGSFTDLNLGGTATEEFTDPYEYYVFPMTYQQTHSGTIAGQGDEPPPVDQYTLSGTVDIEYDGYGTLILPDSTYTNTIRIRTRGEYTVNGMSILDGSRFTMEKFSWFIASSPIPIATFTYDSLIEAGGFVSSAETTTWYLKKQSDQPLNTVERIKPTWDFGPNPTSERVRFTNLPQDIRSLTLFDLNGRMIKEVNVENQVNAELVVSDIPSGMYTLQLKSDRGVYSEKLLVK